MPNTQHPSYRKDIDGLRGIAVLLVVFHHVFPKFFPSGFIGVDVFFVISGFLITDIILRAIDKNNFSFVDFYQRRILRIFPSLFTVLIFALVAGWFLLNYNEFKTLSKHTAAGVAFLSNFFFYRESGYFDTGAELKPLLHLWSLSIEEQFYVLWPIFLLLTRKFFSLKLFLTVFLIALGTSLYWCYFKNISGVYFLSFTRWWEILAGAMLTIVGRYSRILESPCFHQFSSCLGFLFLVLGAVFIEPSPTFPGFAALLPILGTAFLLASKPNAIANKLVLQNPILVFVGFISYPLYLWHWVLLAFVRIIGYAEPWHHAVAGAVSFLAAWLTYKLIETPIRFGGRKPLKALALIAVGALIFGFSSVSYLKKGQFGQIYQKGKNQVSYDDHVGMDCEPSLREKYKITVCARSNTKPVEVLIYGDSHADALFKGFARTDPDRSYMSVGVTGGPGALSHLNLDDLVQNSTAHTVFVVYLYDGAEKLNLMEKVHPWIAAGKKIVLITDNFHLPVLPTNCESRALGPRVDPNLCLVTRSGVESKQSEMRKQFLAIQKQFPKQVRMVDALNVLCHGNECPIAENGFFILNDFNHLSAYGSNLLARYVVQQVFGK